MGDALDGGALAPSDRYVLWTFDGAHPPDWEAFSARDELTPRRERRWRLLLGGNGATFRRERVAAAWGVPSGSGAEKLRRTGLQGVQ